MGRPYWRSPSTSGFGVIVHLEMHGGAGEIDKLRRLIEESAAMVEKRLFEGVAVFLKKVQRAAEMRQK